MSIVLWAMLVSVQTAYFVRDEVVGSMAMAESAQRLRHNESESPKDADNWAKNRAGNPFSWKEYEYNIRLSGNPITGRKVNAFGRAGKWNLLIEQNVFDPENFLRMVTLLDQEE